MLGSLFFVMSLCRYIDITTFRYFVISSSRHVDVSLKRHFVISIFRFSGNSIVKEHFIVKMFGR